MLTEAAGLAVLAAPEPPARHLPALNGWLRHNGRKIRTGSWAVAGLIVAIDGLAGPLQKG